MEICQFNTAKSSNLKFHQHSFLIPSKILLPVLVQQLTHLYSPTLSTGIGVGMVLLQYKFNHTRVCLTKVEPLISFTFQSRPHHRIKPQNNATSTRACYGRRRKWRENQRVCCLLKRANSFCHFSPRLVDFCSSQKSQSVKRIGWSFLHSLEYYALYLNATIQLLCQLAHM